MAVGNRGTPELRNPTQCHPGNSPCARVVAGRRGGPDAASATTVVRIGRGFPRSPPDGPLSSPEGQSWTSKRSAAVSAPGPQSKSDELLIRRTRRGYSPVGCCPGRLDASGCLVDTGSPPDRDRASGRYRNGREARCGLSARRAKRADPSPACRGAEWASWRFGHFPTQERRRGVPMAVTADPWRTWTSSPDRPPTRPAFPDRLTDSSRTRRAPTRGRDRLWE